MINKHKGYIALSLSKEQKCLVSSFTKRILHIYIYNFERYIYEEKLYMYNTIMYYKKKPKCVIEQRYGEWIINKILFKLEQRCSM